MGFQESFMLLRSRTREKKTLEIGSRKFMERRAKFYVLDHVFGVAEGMHQSVVYGCYGAEVETGGGGGRGECEAGEGGGYYVVGLRSWV
jgi:hypothetical protein